MQATNQTLNLERQDYSQLTSPTYIYNPCVHYHLGPDELRALAYIATTTSKTILSPSGCVPV